MFFFFFLLFLEKHKTYHIKDEQLARDGFKKFLKNEMCPYENCRFSNICNHIHCVRDNCYYVLHSSGQLMSHKRKHDRLDSEHAYRLYKMTQQKSTSISPATSLIAISSPAISPSSLSSIIPAANISAAAAVAPAIMQPTVDDGKPTITATSKTPTSSTLNELNLLYGRNVTNPLPIEILQQIQEQQKQFLLKQNYSFSSDGITSDGVGGGSTTTNEMLMMNKKIKIESNLYDDPMHNHQQQNDSLEDGIPKSIIHTSNYLNNDNLILDSVTNTTNNSNLLMSASNLFEMNTLIQRYFTDNCTKQQQHMTDEQQQQQQNEPLNLKNNIQKKISTKPSLIMQLMSTAHIKNTFPPIKCYWNDSNDDNIDNNNNIHLHCLIGGCEEILPDNYNLIIEHIFKHNLYQQNHQSKNVATTLSASTTGITSNLNSSMQVTSIDGFFNRKRGRPPKNRVIEVYNNVS